MKKILFSSLCVGDLYLNWAVICVRSFINTFDELTTPITWEFCTTEEFKGPLKKRLAHFECKNLQFVYTRISPTNKSIDVSKTNILKLHPDEISKTFFWRIKHIDDLKKEQKYNIFVTIDLDSVFISNPVDIIQKFASGNKTFCGTRHKMDISEVFKIMRNENLKNFSLFPKTYINLGFAFLNLDKLPINIYDSFLKMLPGNERIFITEDETFFNIFIDDSEKENMRIQLVGHTWDISDFNSKDLKLVHFSPSKECLHTVSFKEINFPKLIKIRYYDVLKQCADSEKDYIDETILRNICKNQKHIDKYKNRLILIKLTELAERVNA